MSLAHNKFSHRNIFFKFIVVVTVKAMTLVLQKTSKKLYFDIFRQLHIIEDKIMRLCFLFCTTMIWSDKPEITQ